MRKNIEKNVRFLMPKPFQNEAKILEIRVLKNDGKRCEKEMAGGLWFRGEGFALQVGGNPGALARGAVAALETAIPFLGSFFTLPNDFEFHLRNNIEKRAKIKGFRSPKSSRNPLKIKVFYRFI